MSGLDPAIHAESEQAEKWMAGSAAGHDEGQKIGEIGVRVDSFPEWCTRNSIGSTANMRIVLFAFAVSALVSACANSPESSYIIRDPHSAIQIGVDACVSKNVAAPRLSEMHAKLHEGKWHVWQAGRSCEVFSTDIDAVTGIAGPCAVCVA